MNPVAKAAIWGCGMIAGRHEDLSSARTYSHGKAYLRNQHFSSMAVVDVVPDHAKTFAQKFKAEVFNDMASLLDNFRPDVVSVCTPDDHHAAALEILLSHPAAPKAVFCEKPVCATKEELDRLRKLESGGRTRVVVNHSRRFDAVHNSLKQLISSNALGPFVSGHIDYYGGWRHLGVHIVDILRYLLAKDLDVSEAVYCCLSKYSDDPTLHIFGHLDRCPLRMTGHPEKFYQILDMALMFESGQVKIADFGKRIDVFRKTVNQENESILVFDSILSGEGMIDPIVSAVKTIAHYIETMDGDLLDAYGLSEAAKTMDILWKGSALYASQPR